MTQQRTQALFEAGIQKLGVAVDGRTAARLAHYHEMLADWNTRMNLTGDASLETSFGRLYMDSLAPLEIDGLFSQNASMIDVGTGAGFPGLVLAIARPDMDVLLLDSLQKRLTFLQAVIKDLGLDNARTYHARAEDAGHDPALRERYDIAVARAVASAPALLELLLPLVRVGGLAICYKGPSAEEELFAGERAARLLGGGALQTLPVTVPDQPDWQHCVLICEKRRTTARTFPRKAGTPAREPLG